MGSVINAFTENIDIMPTVLDLLDLDIPLQCDGHSLKTFLCGKNPHEWHQEVHWELDFRDVVNRKSEKELSLNFHDCSFAVIRDNHYKYIHFTPYHLFYSILKTTHMNSKIYLLTPPILKQLLNTLRR